MISRRSFIGSLAACAVAPFVPLPDTPTIVAPLAFHPKAFQLTMAPLMEYQRAYNYMRSMEIETLGLHPKAPLYGG